MYSSTYILHSLLDTLRTALNGQCHEISWLHFFLIQQLLLVPIGMSRNDLVFFRGVIHIHKRLPGEKDTWDSIRIL
jgi:hypothetical protein